MHGCVESANNIMQKYSKFFCLQGRRKLFLVGGGAEIEVWKPESSATGARLNRGNFLV